MNNRTRTSTALIRAREYLDKAYPEHMRDPSFVLPAISALARACGVSRVTMYKALSGEKFHKYGSEMKMTRSYEGATAALPHWAVIRDQLQKEILSGSRSQGSMLPSIGNLMQTHRADYKTVKRALENLRDQGRTERYGRGYRVPVVAVPRSSAVVCLVLHTDDPGVLPAMSPRGALLLRSIEAECMRRNCRLRILSPEQVAHTAKISATAEKTFGFIAPLYYLPRPLSSTFIPALLKQGYPVSCIDETADHAIDPAMHGNPLFCRVLLGCGDRCGLDMGRHLVRTGHTTAAIFAHSTRAAWCRNRVQGVRAAYREAGLENAVTVYPLQSFDSPADVEREIMRDPQLSELLRSFDVIQGTSPVPWITPRESYVNRVFPLLQQEVQYRQLRPLFISAYNSGRRHACWVCTTDSIAVAARRFLQAQNRAAPHVCGFDDTMEAYAAGITSYDFNVPAVVKAAFDHVMMSREVSGKSREYNTVEVPGYVVTRASA